ncbi:MAG TPA: NAD(P)-dependent oxidoreductase [Acidimicrobiales bacterium]|jgi:UDP-glucuronate 4-epimerase|nr:NAD(P)-dependent oxidoreductase [Acidimicrobiales bacterium]
MLEGAKVLVTGATGQVGLPVARTLASRNEVWALARFKDQGARQALEEAGVRCCTVDLSSGQLDGLPDDFTHVANFAVAKSSNFQRDLAINAESVGFLMSHCRSARAFLHCSSTAVYQPNGHHRFKETDPLGDNHRLVLPSYSISKIAAEAVARFGAKHWNLPTTIARLNVPYGDNGGWPALHLDWMLAGVPIALHADKPNLFNPIHEDDIVEQVPKLFEIADVPAVVLNWAGKDQVSMEEWCEFLGRLVGVEPKLAYTTQAIASVTTDNTLMHQLIGQTRVPWREGMERMARARHPELFG